MPFPAIWSQPTTLRHPSRLQLLHPLTLARFLPALPAIPALLDFGVEW